MSNEILIKNGLVVDPVSKMREVRSVSIKNGRIVSSEERLESLRKYDADGLVVMPGWIDMHVHCREPGFEYKEDLHSASESAIAGGFATIVAMPNTKPVVDNPSVVHYILEKARKLKSNVFTSAAITVGQAGGRLCDFAALKNAGALFLTDDGNAVADARLMLKALEQAKRDKMLLAQHCEDKRAIGKKAFCMGENIARKLGLEGYARKVELNCVLRDLRLVKQTKAREHFLHLSLKESVEAIAKAKKSALPVTAETAPHYFSLTESALLEKGANAKMNPPLREEKDVKAVRQGLKDGVIDVIATDHAPHSAEEKAQCPEKAPNGIVGLETAVGLSITNLVETKTLSWIELAEKTSLNPARLLSLERKGCLRAGFDADITIIDPNKEWVVDPSKFKSKSRNTPFGGMQLKGKAVAVVAKGVLHELH